MRVKTPQLLDRTLAGVAEYLERVAELNRRYRAGDLRAHVPEELHTGEGALEVLVARHLPASHAALQAAAQSLFFSLPVAFDPAQSVGPYLAAKLRALRSHRTQLHPAHLLLAIPDDLAREYLGREYFVRSRPRDAEADWLAGATLDRPRSSPSPPRTRATRQPR